MKSVWTGLMMTVMLMACGASSALADVGVVDMERLIKQHPRSQADRSILEQYVEDFEDERAAKVSALKKLTEEFETLRQEAEDVGLSDKALSEKRNLAKAKVDEIRERERGLRELASTRQKELTSQELRMRKRVVAEISKIVDTVAKKKKLDLVLDGTGVGIGGYPSVIFYTEKFDITDDIIRQLPQGEE
jgi:outer membrane protein